MKDIFCLTEEQRDMIALMEKIRAYFDGHKELGKVRTTSGMEPWGHGKRYHVRCTYQREYIVYEKDGEIYNVGVYRKEFE